MRFELTMPFGTPVFKTGAFNRSATAPEEARIITQSPGGFNPLFCAGFIETFPSLR